MNYYEISDNLIRFWYHFVFDNRDEIQQDIGRIIYEENREAIAMFVSKGFEDVALSYLTEKNVNGDLGYYYGVIRGYKEDNSKLGRSIELDGLASGIGKAKNRLLVAECKYQSKSVSRTVLEHVRESASIFPAEHYDVYMFSKSGFADDLLSLDDPNVHLVTLEDMTV